LFQIVINLIHHSIVALPHTVKVTEAGKFLASVLPSVLHQGPNLPNQSLPVGFPAYRHEFFPGGGLDLHLM
jgi:hypothetical protein